MALSKPPRNAVYKDSVVAYLALKSHFAVADSHPSDKSLAELGLLMLRHNLRPANGASQWEGEYYDACVQFARSNDTEMKHNNCTVDQLLKANGTHYYSGDNLWRKASESKRIMLNEIHVVFCQEVCRQWPTVPSGTTTLDPLKLARTLARLLMTSAHDCWGQLRHKCVSLNIVRKSRTSRTCSRNQEISWMLRRSRH